MSGSLYGTETYHGNKQLESLQRAWHYNIQSLPEIVLSASRKDKILTTADKLKHLEIFRKEQLLRFARPKYDSAYEEIWVKLEPDKAFAFRLVQEAKKSIADIVNFLGSEYIKQPSFDFKIPSSSDEFNFENLENSAKFYLVAGTGLKTTANYSINLNGRIVPISLVSTETNSGQTSRSFVATPTYVGFNANKPTNEPIFYNTSTPPIFLIESPAVEALHKIIVPYTFVHLQEDLKGVGYTYDGLINTMNKHIKREENLVHALSILWWEHYAGNFGISESDLAERFGNYEKYDRYSGTNELSRRIEKIGIQKSIYLYVNTPNELFGNK